MWKKFYFDNKSERKVNTADVTLANILKPSCPNPTPNEYADLRNNNNQTNNWINPLVCSSCLNSAFPIKQLVHVEYVLFLKMANSSEIK